jgi:hypothetical protein
MNKSKTKVVEAVVWLHNLDEDDELFLLHIELSNALAAAKIKNQPHKYREEGASALLQYYIPSTRWDREFFEEIAISVLGEKYLKVVTSVNE